MNTQHDSHRQRRVSILRLNVLRCLYLMLVVMLGRDVWPVLIEPFQVSQRLEAVAYSFWGALSLLGLLGLRQPLRMLPVVLLQFVYKVIWIVAVALPLRRDGVATGPLSGLEFAMFSGVVIDLLVIPWQYVIANYILGPGEPWRSPGTSLQE